MTQIFIEFCWFVAFGLWTLGTYLVAKYLGQEEAYRNGFADGHSAGYDLCEMHYEVADEPWESIAGLWSDEDTTILPPKGDQGK